MNKIKTLVAEKAKKTKGWLSDHKVVLSAGAAFIGGLTAASFVYRIINPDNLKDLKEIEIFKDEDCIYNSKEDDDIRIRYTY